MRPGEVNVSIRAELPQDFLENMRRLEDSFRHAYQSIGMYVDEWAMMDWGMMIGDDPPPDDKDIKDELKMRFESRYGSAELKRKRHDLTPKGRGGYDWRKGR